MPSSLAGLLIFIALLMPGFVHHTWRRRTVPLRPDSPLLETTNLVTISLVADLAALTLFGVARWIWPSAFLDPAGFLAEPKQFFIENLGAASRTAVGLLFIATLIAWLIAARVPPLRWLATRFDPSIVDVPAWYEVFEALDDKYVHVGCSMKGGGYISGILAWYSTDTAETDDRSLVLAPPFRRIEADGSVDVSMVGRIVLSARDIEVMEVTYLESLDWETSGGS